MSNHPESHDYTLQLAKPLFPHLKREFDFSSLPHCVHTPTPCGIRVHPARDNARSWSLLLFLTACLSRAETVTAQVSGTIFLSAGLFHFKHNVLLSFRFSTGYSIQPNCKSRNRQQQILSGGKTAGQEYIPACVPTQSARTCSSTVYFLSTFSEIAQLEHVVNR